MSHPKIENRPYQTRIVQKALDLFRGGVNSVLVISPTGSGKTVMGLGAMRQLQKETGMRIGWSAMRRELLHQARRENEVLGFNIPGFVTISMFDRNPPKVDALVVDEAHHDATETMGNLHSMVQPTYVLGLTATPIRPDKAALCFEKTIDDCGIQQLISDGYLSQYQHFTIDEYTPESVVRVYTMDPSRWGKSVVFFHKTSDCQRTLELFKKHEVAAELVTHDSDRDAQLHRFSTGETTVLINMIILGEGFNSPDLKTVFVRPSVKKPTIQMAGRVLRLHPDAPFKQIVQCKHTNAPFTKVAKPAEQFVLVGQQWLSLVENRQLDSQVQDALKQVLAAPVAFDADRFIRKRATIVDEPKSSKPKKPKKSKKQVITEESHDE